MITSRYFSSNSSWSKFCTAFTSASVLSVTTTLYENGLESVQKPTIEDLCNIERKHSKALAIFGIPLGIYHIDNLYSQYKYNKSLEHEIKVEINGVKETVNASPKYFDWYTGYNVLCALGFAMRTMSFFSDKPYQDGIGSTAIKLGLLSKLISLKDTYQDFQYTDSKGNIISPEIILDNVLTYTSE
jgi:hypothetical protein